VHALADLPAGQARSDEFQDAPLLEGESGQRVGAPGLVAHPPRAAPQAEAFPKLATRVQRNAA
jgi:hypothetical protein